MWGRDELNAGEMWNSNSVTSWLIARIELNVESIKPPAGGRVLLVGGQVWSEAARQTAHTPPSHLAIRSRMVNSRHQCRTPRLIRMAERQVRCYLSDLVCIAFRPLYRGCSWFRVHRRPTRGTRTARGPESPSWIAPDSRIRTH